jgi:hypothetical protein
MFSCSQQKKADLVILGGKIYTLEEGDSVVEAVAVRDGRIVFAGSDEGAAGFAGPATVRIRLEGETVLPGLVDAHAHISGLGRALSELNLVGTDSPARIREMVLEREATEEGEGWISGRGWDQNDWAVERFPTWKDLEGTESRPVALRRIDGHAVWLNRKAMEICGISSATPDPEGGAIIRDEKGEPTGILLDNAAELVTSKMPEPTRAERTAWIKKALKEINRNGLVGVHDAGVDGRTLEIYRHLAAAGSLSVRVNAMIDPADEGLLESTLARGPSDEFDHLLVIRSVKLFADGALGSRGAALLEPYSDRPDQRGLLVTPRDELARITEAALDHGFQVCIHAIGDAANRTALDVFEEALEKHPSRDARLRIEHAQVVSPQDVERFARLGVIASMQPTHATSDMDWAEERLGRERIEGAYAWRKLIRSGATIACGSDFPVEDVNPLKGIYAAVTRKSPEGDPPGGWYPEECMTIQEAVRGFTINAAYAQFAERIRGTIAVGKLGDFTILDRDIFSCPSAEILDARVVYTIVGGRIVYEREEPRP